MKKYKLLADNAEYPQGTEVHWHDSERVYKIYSPDGKQLADNEFEYSLHDWQVESNSCWEEIKEEQETKRQIRTFTDSDGVTYYGKDAEELAKKRGLIQQEDGRCEYCAIHKENYTCTACEPTMQEKEEKLYSIESWFLETTSIKDEHSILKRHTEAYKSREAAEIELLLRKLMVKRWQPKRRVKYYYWDTLFKEVQDGIWEKDSIDIDQFLLGNCHKTKEDAEAYGKQLQKCVDFYLSQTNKE